MNHQTCKLQNHHLVRNNYVLGLVNGRMMLGVSFERGTWRPARLARDGDAGYFRNRVKVALYR